MTGRSIVFQCQLGNNHERFEVQNFSRSTELACKCSWKDSRVRAMSQWRLGWPWEEGDGGIRRTVQSSQVNRRGRLPEQAFVIRDWRQIFESWLCTRRLQKGRQRRPCQKAEMTHETPRIWTYSSRRECENPVCQQYLRLASRSQTVLSAQDQLLLSHPLASRSVRPSSCTTVAPQLHQALERQFSPPDESLRH